MKLKWPIALLQEEALKYQTVADFCRNSDSAFQSAYKRGLLKQVCAHMKPTKRAKWTLEEIAEEALKYQTLADFRKNSPALQAAYKMGVVHQVCAHMYIKRRKWTLEDVKAEALKYETRGEFRRNSPSAYGAALRTGVLDDVCSHMRLMVDRHWTYDSVAEEAAKYKTRSEFQKGSKASQLAYKNGLLDSVSSHMKKGGSKPEQVLFNEIKKLYPKAQKLMDRKVRIPDKPHIQGFELDIYIPELRKAIEFDGTYWHSIDGLRRSRHDWPEEDLINYHTIKDSYFGKRGINIFHVPERLWQESPDDCLGLVLHWLSSAGEKPL